MGVTLLVPLTGTILRSNPKVGSPNKTVTLTTWIYLKIRNNPFYLMQSLMKTPEEYIESLPDDRKQVIGELRKVILENLPPGFTETMDYGMLAYVVPHSLYPHGYHCDPKHPLPFMNLASQKNFVALYHMGIYGDKKLLEWFTSEYGKHSKAKPDMGKSCIRFKKSHQVPYKLIGELAQKLTPEQWIAFYEENIKSK